MKTVAQFRAHLGEQADGLADDELEAYLAAARAELAPPPVSAAALAAGIRTPLVEAMQYEALAKSLAAEEQRTSSLEAEIATLRATLAAQTKSLDAVQPFMSVIRQIAERQVAPVPLSLMLPEGGFAPVNHNHNNVDVKAVPVAVSLEVPEKSFHFAPHIDVKSAEPANITLPPMQLTLTFPKITSVLRTVIRKDGEIAGTRDEYFYE